MLLGATAQPALAAEAQDATFVQLLHVLADSHPRIEAARQLVRAGRADVSAARSALRPQAGLDAEIGWSGRDTGGLAVLPEARVTQLVYDGGRTPAEIRRRAIRVDLLGVQEQAALASLSAELAQAWIAHSRAAELRRIGEEQVSALRELESLVLEIASYDRGRASDVVIVQSRLQQAVTTLQSREIALQEAADRIREVAVLPVEPQGAVPDIAPFLPASSQGSADLADAAPPVRIADYQVRESAEAERGARNWWMPRLALEGARTSQVDALGDTRLFNAFALRLRVSSLPFDSGGGRARLEAARASLESSEATAALTRIQMRDRARRLWTFQASRSERMPSLVDLVDRADEARTIVFEQFRIGRRTILDLLAYDLERFNVRTQLANERYDIAQTQYELMGILGRIYPALAGDGTAAVQPGPVR